MGAAEEWYGDPWNYPAKVGSHGTLILMCWAFILATRFRWVERLFGGLDKVYKAHRHIGESAFFLIFLHPVFLAVGHADSVSAFFQYGWFSGNWVRNTGLIALANGEILRYPVLRVWHGTWVVLVLAAYAYIRVFYRRFGPLYDYAVESAGEVGCAKPSDHQPSPVEGRTTKTLPRAH